MKNKLWLFTALALLAAGCKTLEPRPPPADCSAPGGESPKPPPVRTIPDLGPLPALPPSTHIVAGLCTATNSYAAMGVDTENKRYTFLIKGSRASQQQAFRNFYEAGVPVTVYTKPVKLRKPGPQPTEAPEPPPPAPSPKAVPDQGTEGTPEGARFDPCQNIGEDPPPLPKPGGSNSEQSQLQAFRDLAWRTAHGLDAVSDPAPPTTSTVPEPR